MHTTKSQVMVWTALLDAKLSNEAVKCCESDASQSADHNM